MATASPKPGPEIDPSAEMMVVIDGAHIRAAHGYQSRHIDVTVGKIEVAGNPPRRFALAPKGADAPLSTLRQALREQGWQPGRAITVLSDGEPAFPGLVRAAAGESVICILDAQTRIFPHPRVCEAAHRRGESAAELMPNQPRGDIRGMGNRLRHAYDRISLDLIWNAARHDLPGLAADARRALAQLRADQNDASRAT
jgi:Protein of unknown function DUF86